MNDPIVQVRDIRASIAEQFGFDCARIIAWAREQTATRKAARKNAKPDATGGEADPRKRRARPARA